jgi:hypothetical protein
VKLVLERPLRVGDQGEQLTELVLRERICAGDYRGLKLGSLMTTPAEVPVDDYLKIAARLSGLPDVVINDLGEADLAAVINAINSFRLAGQKT